MKEHEFWRDQAGGRVYAVELLDGVVFGICGALDAGEIDDRFLASFDYTPDQAAWLEKHRDDFDLFEPISRHAVLSAMADQSVLFERLVSDAMHHGVLTCHSGSSLHEVARMMAAHGIHAVAVWGDEEDDSVGFRGMVSDLDLVAAAACGESSASSALRAARTTSSAWESATLLDAARTMARHRVAHLVVLADDRDRPVGVLSTLDVARALAAPL